MLATKTLIHTSIYLALGLSIATVQAESMNANSEALSLYGQARVSIDSKSGDGTEGASINSNASRIGAKGAYDSGIEGTKLIYQAELRYETTDSVSGVESKQVEFREGFAGLKGKAWGKVRMGRLSTSYKNTLTKIDPWNDNAPQSRAGGRQGSSEFHSSYFNNTIDYKTPTFAGGFNASVWLASEYDDSAKPLHNTGTLKNYTGGSVSGASVKYNKGGLFIAVDYLKMDADNFSVPNLSNGTGTQIGARYKFGASSVAVLYEDVEDLGLGTNNYINFIHNIGKAKIIAAYGTNRDGAQYGNKDWNNYSIGLKYKLMNKSELLAAYNSRMDDTGDKDFNTLTIGMNAKFGY